MKDIDFNLLDKKDYTSGEGVILQSKMIEWAALIYLSRDKDVVKCYEWIINSVYPINSTLFNFDRNTYGYSFCKKEGYGEQVLKVQSIYDAISRDDGKKELTLPGDEGTSIIKNLKLSLFPNEKIDDLNVRTKYKDYSNGFETKSVDKVLNIKVGENLAFDTGISIVNEIMSYIYLIDSVIYNSFVVDGTVQQPSDKHDKEYENYIDKKRSKLISLIRTNIKDSFLYTIGGCLSRFSYIRSGLFTHKKQEFTVRGVNFSGQLTRQNMINYLVDLLIIFNSYKVVIDKSLYTFVNEIKDPCKAESDKIKGITGSTFNDTQSDLYSFTSAMFSYADLEFTITNNKHAVSNLTYDSNNRTLGWYKYIFKNDSFDIENVFIVEGGKTIQDKNELDEFFKNSNAISRLFSPRGVVEFHPINNKFLSDIISNNTKEFGYHGLSFAVKSRNGQHNNFTTLQLYFEKDNVFSINKSNMFNANGTPKPFLPVSYLVGGIMSDIGNSCLITNDGFFVTMGIIDWTSKSKQDLDKFFIKSERFTLNEFSFYIREDGFGLVDASLSQGFNILSKNKTLAVSYEISTVGFCGEVGFKKQNHRHKVDEVISSYVNESTKKLFSEFSKSNVSMNRLVEMFLCSPGESIHFPVEHQDLSLSDSKVRFPRLSETYCTICNTAITSAVAKSGKSILDKTKILYNTEYPILNQFRSDLMIKFLSSKNDNVTFIDRRHLNSSLQKFYRNQDVPMSVFEINLFNKFGSE